MRGALLPRGLCWGIAAVGLACSSTPPVVTPPTPPGPGVTFTFPTNGQLDVPVGARLVLALTSPIQTVAATQTCQVDGQGNVTGTFCIVGPEGVVPATVSVASSGTVLTAQPTRLNPGTRYQVFARPALIADTAVNLPATAPLFTFVTRQDAITVGTAPVVVSVNDDDPAAYQAGGPAPKQLFIDFMSLRLLFSEPLDESTVVAGQSFLFQRVDPSSGATTEVGGTLLVQGIHLTFDPAKDLDSTATYQVQLTQGIKDRAGQAFSPVTLTLHPLKAAADGQLFDQILSVVPPGTASGPQGAASALAGVPVNSTDIHSQLIGNPVLGVLSGAIQSQLADPSAFPGGAIPLTIRKGQQIDLSPMSFQLDGALPSGYQTGTLHMVFLSDANGVITRNGYRSSDTLPDDALAPTTVDFTFDAAMFAEDAQGNVMATQSIYGIHMSGTSVAQGTALAINVVGAIELDTLGINKATANITLQQQTDPTAAVTSDTAPALKLTASYPAAAQDDFPADRQLILFFSKPVDLGPLQADAGMVLMPTALSTPVPLTVTQAGSSLVLTPAASLTHGTGYTLALGGLVDLAGQPITFSSGDPTGGTGSLTFSTQVISAERPAAPLLTSVVPGAPCALTGGDASGPGHCVGGKTTDSTYLPFQLPANRSVVGRFSQPMRLASMTVGTSCGQGAIRVEQVNGTGQCTGAVSGTVAARQMGFAFTPAAPWTLGQAYRLTLVGGPDDQCDPGELCGEAGAPLNTAPLNGINNPDGGTLGGGPDVVIDFVPTAPTSNSDMVLSGLPYTDGNGNGFIDADEQIRDPNRASLVVQGTTGLISSVTFNTPRCSSTSASGSACQVLHIDSPVTVGALLSSCPVDSTGKPADAGTPCIPIFQAPSTIEASSTSMTVTSLGIPTTQDTGMFLMRLGKADTGGAMAYIINEPGSGTAEIVTPTHAYLDAPDLLVLGGLLSHNLHSYPLDFVLKGPQTFLPDGRMQAALQNLEDIPINVSLGVGTINLIIPKGELHLTLVGPPIK